MAKIIGRCGEKELRSALGLSHRRLPPLYPTPPWKAREEHTGRCPFSKSPARSIFVAHSQALFTHSLLAHLSFSVTMLALAKKKKCLSREPAAEAKKARLKLETPTLEPQHHILVGYLLFLTPSPWRPLIGQGSPSPRHQNSAVWISPYFWFGTDQAGAGREHRESSTTRTGEERKQQSRCHASH